MKDKWYKHIRYENKWVDKTRSPFEFWIALLNDLRQYFIIESYTQTYRCDLNGNTEYLITNFNFASTEDKLTVHIFSCYCDSFVEGDKPPF